MTSSGPRPTDDDQPVVVLLNCLGGAELVAVHEILTAALATPVILLGPLEAATQPLSLDLRTGLLSVGDRRGRPVLVWARHTDAATLLAQPAATGATDPLSATQWSDLFGQLDAVTAAGSGLPGGCRSRLGQLLDAALLGITTPRTVVTTDVAAAARELGTARVVVKTPDFRLVEPDRSRWPAHLPRVMRAARLGSARLGSARPGSARPGIRRAGAPVLVQEYIPHTVELRVFYLDGAICAFAVDKPDPATPWTDPDAVRVTKVDCPDAASAAVHALSAAWGLHYAAYDLLISPTGEPVFLEANRDGDWLWFEARASWHGVSMLAAVMVHALFVRQAAASEAVAG